MLNRIFIGLFMLALLPTHMQAIESIVAVNQSFSQSKVYAGGNFLVKLQIKRQGLNSFFQIEQELPKGMTAIGVESQGATFNFKDGKVKYNWLRLPAEEEIQVIYKVTVPFEMRGKKIIGGIYYYIVDEEKEIFNIPHHSIEVIEYIAPSDSLAEKTLLGIIDNTADKPSYMEEEKMDLIYKIQILSSTKQLDKDSLRKAYGIKEKLQVENYHGLYKYTTGSFGTYEQARDYKNSLDFSRYIPFVIAYNRGNRITIGEAMELASKKRTAPKK
jgi:hypothetical protein